MTSLECIRLRPARPGLRVPIPERAGQVLPQEGAEVVPSSYWERRLADGDVLHVPTTEAETARPARARRGETGEA